MSRRRRPSFGGTEARRWTAIHWMHNAKAHLPAGPSGPNMEAAVEAIARYADRQGSNVLLSVRRLKVETGLENGTCKAYLDHLASEGVIIFLPQEGAGWEAHPRRSPRFNIVVPEQWSIEVRLKAAVDTAIPELNTFWMPKPIGLGWRARAVYLALPAVSYTAIMRSTQMGRPAVKAQVDLLTEHRLIANVDGEFRRCRFRFPNELRGIESRYGELVRDAYRDRLARRTEEWRQEQEWLRAWHRPGSATGA